VFINLSTAHLDGTIVNFPTGNIPGEPFLSAGVGVWRHFAGSEFLVLFYHAMHVGDTPVGYQRVRATVAVARDGKTSSGTFTNDILDPAENVLVSIPGTVTAKRIALD